VTPPPAAILDIDGTLVDTNYQHAVAWFRAFRRLDVTLPLYRIHRHIGMGSDQLVGALAGDDFERAPGAAVRALEGDLYMGLRGSGPRGAGDGRSVHGRVLGRRAAGGGGGVRVRPDRGPAGQN
jgi:hypothetical protein